MRDNAMPALGRLDVAVAGLLVLLAGWLGLSAAVAGGSWDPALLALAAAAVYVVARVAADALPLTPAAAVVGVGMTLALRSGRELVDRLRGPLGYGNATAAFFVLAAAAGVLLAAHARTTALRVVGGVAAVAFAAVPLANRSWAAAAGVVGLAVTVAASRAAGRRWQRVVAVMGAVVVLATIGATVALAGQYHREHAAVAGTGNGLPPQAVGTGLVARLTERRVVLWDEALAMAARAPLLGVGPGRFGALSATARADADVREAHSEFLQVAAEGGIPAGLLLAAALAAAFARLAAAPQPGAATVAVAALAASAMQAGIDYIWHFPAVPLAAAALVATAAGPLPTRRRRQRHVPGQVPGQVPGSQD